MRVDRYGTVTKFLHGFITSFYTGDALLEHFRIGAYDCELGLGFSLVVDVPLLWIGDLSVSFFICYVWEV